MATYEPKNHASITSAGSTPLQEQDNRRLQQMGKKSLLKHSSRGLIPHFLSENFGIVSIFGSSCTLLGTWEGLLGTFIRPLENGGPGGTVYAFVFAWVGTTAIFVVLSELISMHVRAPTAGGQYHWAAMLALIRYQKFLSYITGWWAVLGWQTALAVCVFMTGTMIQDAVILGNSLYKLLSWQGTLVVWATLICALLVNLVGGKLLPRIGSVLLVVYILGFFSIMILLICLSDHKPKEEVFLQFFNSGGFSTQALSWFVGMTSCAFGFVGGDAAVHMSEEVANVSRIIPHALIFSVLLNGCLGFGMLIAILFCAGNLKGVLSSTTGSPFMEIIYKATSSLPGSLFMCSILIIIYCCSLMGLLAAVSRQLWSFSRDRGVPGWRWWSQISSFQELPVQSIILTVVVSAMLALINIGSSVALDAIVSMAVSALYLFYLMVLILLLYRCIRGDISLYNHSGDDVVNAPGAKLAWGPFQCPGVWGIAINAFAIVYIMIMHPSVRSMNWSVLGTGGSSFLAVGYYFARARHIYTGPIREL
ncbi:amino acid permease-domain-containing protein [Aspergillus pseudotamarii]|uniref:Amino acid permease-domain-containing protein n=1 Tax=Aspergillus pseudotamarii TaxID=132259 RepID=A0A5N6SZR4_ASPPS|nr:amino acid permease-domain-containing protein [Aspergillus pseudotamarii]KAE8139259.1 amino acid permease-domain-containing protein [Aspergillus pseudotamarii]